MTPSTLDIASDFNGEETADAYRRRVPGDSTRSHWSRRRAKVRRQWRDRARRLER